MKTKIGMTFALLVASCSQLTQAGTSTWQWDLTPGHSYSQKQTDYWGRVISQTQKHYSNPEHSIQNCDTDRSNCGTSSFSVTSSQNNQQISADFSAWADTGGYYDNQLQSADMYFYGDASNKYGWGVVNQDEYTQVWDSQRGTYVRQPIRSEHAFDSYNRDYDMVLVSFDTDVALNEVGIGWTNSYYTDFSVLAFAGNGGPQLSGNTWRNVAGSGNWAQIGNYTATGSGYYAVNSGNTTSKYWLIGAYNSAFNNPHEQYNCVDVGNDAFKLVGLSGKASYADNPPDKVSAPAGIGVLAMGLGFIALRRRMA